MNFLKNNYRDFYNFLSVHKVGSSGFDTAWKVLAGSKPQFGSAQHAFIRASHYDPARNNVLKSTGVDINKRSRALQDVLWSTAVQHGAAGANRVFKNAGVNNKMSDKQIIEAVYNERMANNGMKYFSKSSSSIRKGVVNRFKREKQDALAMLG